jgi:plastocyanin
MKNSFVSKSSFLLGVGLLLAIMTISDSCSKGSMAYVTGTGGAVGSKGSDGPGVNEVWIQNLAFNPPTITVAAGTTITWTNKDATTHHLVSSQAPFDSGDMGSGATFSYKFSSSGSFFYYCSIHPSMTGTVIVN